MRPAIFLDRDGVVNAAVHRDSPAMPEGTSYTAPYTLAEFKVLPGAAEAIRAFRALGFIVIAITNQPDVAYGNMTKESFSEILAATKKLGFDDIFVCAHGKNDGCECKKPKPGMILSAAKKWEIDLLKSYMIGDTANDIVAGKAAGCRTILLRRSYNEAEWGETDAVADDLAEAVKLIAEGKHI